MTTFAQAQTKTMKLDASQAMLLPEFGAMVVLENDTLTIDMITPAEQRSAAYKELDLRKGDQILMCNGKRVIEIEQLRGMVDSIEVGGAIKLGLRRDGHLQIVSYAKADPANLPGRMVMMKQESGPGGMIKKTVSFGGGDSGEGTVMVLDGGLLIGPGKDGPVVMAMLPDAAKKISGEMPMEGDMILSINGELDTNMQAFQELYDSFPDGEKITIKFERDGKQYTATYVKAPLETGNRKTIHK
jgi:S1-C subfamily serine protease